jgi:hypothetical protein
VKRAFPLAVLLCLNTGLAAPPLAPDSRANGGGPSASGPPRQLEARVPFAPTSFPSMGHTYLVYELYLTNVSSSPIDVRRLDVLDAQATSSQPIASFEDEKLDAILRDVGAGVPEGGSKIRQVGPGQTVVAFMWIPFDNNAHVPGNLFHRLDDRLLDRRSQR